MTKSLQKIILTALVIKFLYFLFAIAAFSFSEKPFKADYESFISLFKKNDTYWYEKITESGYSEISDPRDLGYHDGPDFKQSEWAFFPFYPMLVRGVSAITPGKTDNAFLLVSLFTSLLAFVLFYLFMFQMLDDNKKAYFYTILLMLFPFHFYFSVFYTEAIFFSLFIACFLALNNRKYLLFSLLIIPLVLTRPNGIVLLLPFYLFMLEKEGLLDKKHFQVSLLFSKENILRSLYFISGVVAFILYCLFQYQKTGELFAFSIAQQGWYRDFMFPLLSLFRHGDFATQFNSIYTILFILLAIFSWKKFPLSLNIFIWIGLLLPLTSGSVLSMQRFISLIFPLTMVIGSFIYKYKKKNLILGLLFVLQLFSFYFWIIEHPLGY